MRSTFFGLETARRALFTQQSALHTTSHNIANANTEGYSRQRVNFEAETPWPKAGMNRPELPGQMGTGVKAGDITRVRDQFLDLQYRGENSKAGMWGSKAEALRRMEDILNEPSDEGLAHVMNQLSSSLQEVATHPEDEGARKVAVQRAVAVADTFNYLNNTLIEVQGDIQSQMETEVHEVNSLLWQIEGLNEQISKVEPHGYLPNDLYDKRDALIDQLSEKMDITVDDVKTSESAKANAAGIYEISVMIDGEAHQLIGKNETPKGLSLNGEGSFGIGELEKVEGEIVVTGDPTSIPNFTPDGSIRGLKESSDFYGDQIENLNEMASTFITQFNDQHAEGTDLYGEEGEDGAVANFFVGDHAGDIAVNEDILNDVNRIAASGDGAPGNGENAIELAKVKDTPVDSEDSEALGGRSVQDFYEGMIGELGVRAEEANRLQTNSAVLKNSVDQNRQSVSGVSLDEEMSNLIQFQHAYNAAARSMTVVDEMLDRIINQMGIVGR